MLAKNWLNEAATFLPIIHSMCFFGSHPLKLFLERLNRVHAEFGLFSSGIITIKFPPLVALTRPSAPSGFDECWAFFWIWIKARLPNQSISLEVEYTRQMSDPKVEMTSDNA